MLSLVMKMRKMNTVILLLHFQPSLTSHMSLGCFLKVCGLTFSIPDGMMNSCTVAGADPGFFLGGVHH